MPPKVWHGQHEPPPDSMPDDEKRANEAIANWLHNDWLKGKKARTLDVGGSFPWLAHSLGKLGHDATAMDGEPHPFDGMRCKLIQADFETAPLENDAFDLITIIHCFEHLERPVDALQRMRSVLSADGFIFMRLPDHDVSGFERDLTPGHATIHPFFHCTDSLLECLVQLDDALEFAWTSPLLPGQRDLILRPI